MNRLSNLPRLTSNRPSLGGFQENISIIDGWGAVPRGDVHLIYLKYTVARATQRDIQASLAEYKAKWEEETMLTSSLPDVLSNIWFLRVIGLGESALPFLYDLVRQEGGLWCIALEAITGVTPDLEDPTDFQQQTSFWLNWLNENGHNSPAIPELCMDMVASS